METVTLRAARLVLTIACLVMGSVRASDHASSAISPDEALRRLEAGNERFASGKTEHPAQDAHRRQELISGQSPFAIVLGCSDSRVPPEIVFDQGLGEIFDVRVAGNVLDPATLASLEYAVDHLGSRLILILGHEKCGAVQAALSLSKGASAGSPDLDSLVHSIQLNVRGDHLDDPLLRQPVRHQVDGVAQDLLKRSNLIRKKVDAGEVRVVRGIYALSSGRVAFWDDSLASSDSR